MTLKPIVTFGLVVGLYLSLFPFGGLDNMHQYKESREKVQDAVEGYNTTYQEFLVKKQKLNKNLDRFGLNDMITATGSSVEKVSLLSSSKPTKIVSTGSSVNDVPEGEFYRFEIKAADMLLLLKAVDESSVVCSMEIIALSDRLILDVYLGGA